MGSFIIMTGYAFNLYDRNQRNVCYFFRFRLLLSNLSILIVLDLRTKKGNSFSRPALRALCSFARKYKIFYDYMAVRFTVSVMKAVDGACEAAFGIVGAYHEFTFFTFPDDQPAAAAGTFSFGNISGDIF